MFYHSAQKLSVLCWKEHCQHVFRNHYGVRLVYGAESPTTQGGKFDMKALEKDIQTDADNGCQFYVTPFPQDEYLARMRGFARDVMPSFADRNHPAASKGPASPGRSEQFLTGKNGVK